jgi:hypothetical protein
LNKIAVFSLVFIVFCLLGLGFTTNTVEAQIQPYQQQINVEMVVQVLDINPSQKTANVNLILFVRNYPDNITSFMVNIAGNGDTNIICYNEGTDNSGWLYQGRSNETIWFLEGSGETYPFDSYSLHFRIQTTSVPHYLNCSLTNNSQAYFDGPKQSFLKDLWVENNSSIPKSWSPASVSGNDTTQELTLSIAKTGNAFNTAFLEFMVPIIGCYYLLVATLLLDPKKHLNERLTIYLAIFVFVPAFLIAIQNYLPYRSSLSFPELLLTNLVIGTTIFGVFSIFGKQGRIDFEIKWLKNLKLKHNKWDIAGIILSLLVFVSIYFSTLFGKITFEAMFIIAYLIVPAYFIWVPFENIKKLSLKANLKSIVAFILLTLLLTGCFAATFFLPNYFLLVEVLLIGIVFGAFLRNLVWSLLLNLFGGVVSTFLAGILTGLFFGQSFYDLSGLPAMFRGFYAMAAFGYLIGFYAATGGFIGAFFVQLYTEYKNSHQAKREEEKNLDIM